MSIKSKLEEKADEVLDWAARRQFEEDGYNVQWEGDEFRDNWLGIGDKDILTMERYNSGPSTGAKGHTPDPNHSFVVIKGSDVWKKVRGDYSWFKDSVLEFGKGNPRAAMNLGDDVENKIAANLCANRLWGSVAEGEDASGWSFSASVPGDELSLENAIAAMDPENWSGQFASKFYTTFGAHGKHWNQVLQGDFFLAANLMAAADAQVAMIAAARDDVFKICDSLIDVLKTFDGGDSGSGIAPLLFMAGALVAIPLAVGTGGAAAPAIVAAAFTITGNLVGMAEKGGRNTEIEKPAGAEKYNISGENVFWAVNSGNNALNRVITVMTEKEQEVSTSLWNAYNGVLDNRDDYEIQIKDAESLSLGERETSADKAVLIDAATKSFPQAVAPLSAANKALNGLETTSAFAAETYDSTTMLKEPFDAVSDLLQDLTARNTRIVTLAGELIFNFAVEADMVDKDAAVEVEGQADKLKVDDIFDNSDPKGSGRDHEPYEPPPARPPQYR